MKQTSRIDAEKVSYLVDGELQGGGFDDVVRRLAASDALQRDWRDYHLIGDALRRSLPERVGIDISARVASALEKEPAYLLPVPSRDKARLRRRLAPVVGFAMAASLTAVAVLNLNPAATGQQAMPSMAAAPVESAHHVALASNDRPAISNPVERRSDRNHEDRTLPAAAVAVLASGERVRVAGNVSYPREAADLYDYLVNYGRYSQNAGPDAMLDHVSLASYRR